MGTVDTEFTTRRAQNIVHPERRAFLDGAPSLSGLEGAELDRERMFLGALLVAGSIFYTGYRVGNALDDIAGSVKRVADAVDEVKDAIVSVAGRLEDLFRKLDQVISELRGHVTLTALQQAMGSADNASQDIRTYLRDEPTLRRNLGEVQAANRQLTTAVNQMRRLHGPNSAGFLIAAAPMMALWSQSFMAVQRVKNDDAGIPNAEGLTVWDHEFHKANLAGIRQMFGNFDGVRSRLEHILANRASSRIAYRSHPISGQLVDSGIPLEWGYPGTDPKYADLFRVWDDGGEWIAPRRLTCTINRLEPRTLPTPPVTPPVAPTWVWDSCEFVDTPAARRATAMWNRVGQEEYSAHVTLQMFKDSAYIMSRVEECAERKGDWVPAESRR